jgi:hypothetical protein
MEESNNSGVIETQGDVIDQVEETTQEGSEEVIEVKADEKVEPAKKEEDSKFAAKFAALSRKEKALKQKEREIERRMKALESSQPKVQEQVQAPVEPWESKLKKNPLEALKEKGYDLDTLIKLALNDGKLTPDMQMQLMREELENGYKTKFEEIEKKLTAKEQAEIDRAKQEEEKRHQQVIENFKSELNDFIAEQAETYEQIHLEEAQDLVFEIIEKHYKETSEIDEETGEILTPGQVLDMKEAADQVEEYLVERLQKRLGSTKAKKLLESQLSKKEPNGEKKASVTLTNEQSQQATGTRTRVNSREESVAEAAKILRWNSD